MIRNSFLFFLIGISLILERTYNPHFTEEMEETLDSPQPEQTPHPTQQQQNIALGIRPKVVNTSNSAITTVTNVRRIFPIYSFIFWLICFKHISL